MAFFRVSESAGVREGLEGMTGESAESGVVVGEGAEMLSLAVISRSWASMLSVGEVGRDRVRFRVRWKARRSCLRFAERVAADEPERIDLALLRRDVRVSLGEDMAGESVELELGVVDGVLED